MGSSFFQALKQDDNAACHPVNIVNVLPFTLNLRKNIMIKVASFLLPALFIMSMDAMAENNIAKDVANLRQQHYENFKNTVDELKKNRKNR